MLQRNTLNKFMKKAMYALICASQYLVRSYDYVRKRKSAFQKEKKNLSSIEKNALIASFGKGSSNAHIPSREKSLTFGVQFNLRSLKC